MFFWKGSKGKSSKGKASKGKASKGKGHATGNDIANTAINAVGSIGTGIATALGWVTLVAG